MGNKPPHVLRDHFASGNVYFMSKEGSVVQNTTDINEAFVFDSKSEANEYALIELMIYGTYVPVELS